MSKFIGIGFLLAILWAGLKLNDPSYKHRDVILLAFSLLLGFGCISLGIGTFQGVVLPPSPKHPGLTIKLADSGTLWGVIMIAAGMVYSGLTIKRFILKVPEKK